MHTVDQIYHLDVAPHYMTNNAPENTLLLQNDLLSLNQIYAYNTNSRYSVHVQSQKAQQNTHTPTHGT
jgi:hypothetical protein